MGWCAFCEEASKKRSFGKPHIRSRSAKNIVDEMEYLIGKYGLKKFRFTDATFEDRAEDGVDKASEIFDEIINRGLDVHMHIFSRSELITENSREYLKKAYQAGVECIYIGIEAGNPKDLSLYNKNATVEDSKRALRIIRECGIHPTFGFINFNPYSDYETLLTNADFLYTSGLGHIFYLYQTQLEILTQSSIRQKLLKDGLLPEGSNYLTGYHDYQYVNPRVKEVKDIIFSAYKKPPTNFMETTLAMDRIWVNKHLQNFPEYKNLEKLFAELDEINRWDNETNFLFFKTCIEMSRNGATTEQLEQYSASVQIDKTYDDIASLYMKLSVRVKKIRLQQNLRNQRA